MMRTIRYATVVQMIINALYVVSVTMKISKTDGMSEKRKIIWSQKNIKMAACLSVKDAGKILWMKQGRKLDNVLC